MKGKRKKKNTGVRLIKKANKLVEARYKFDIWETRVFLSVLAQIKRDDEDFKVYRIWHKDVIKTFGLKSAQSYAFLRDAASGLMKKSFYVANIVNGKKRNTEYHLIRSADTLDKEEAADKTHDYVDITVDPKMKPLLLELGQNYKGEKGEYFTAYDLRNVVKLGAYHSVRVYELLKQYQRIGSRELDVDDIKAMLEITDEYPLFGNFFQKIITPSVKAINDYTDLTITKLEKIKTGRKVTSLYFEFRKKTGEELIKMRGEVKSSKRSNNGVKEATKKDRLFDKYYEIVVKKFGVTPSVFLSFLDKIEEAAIEKAIRVTRRMKANNEIKKNVAGFFIKALKDGYTDLKEEIRSDKKEKTDHEKFIEAKLQELDAELESNINQKIREVLANNPELTQEAIDKIKTNPISNKEVLLKEKELKRVLNIDDYRQDIKLRHMVRANIVELSKEQFYDIENEYKAKMEKIKTSKYSPF